MRKVFLFVLLLVVFLVALVVDRNAHQESKSARSRLPAPPEVRDDDILELLIGAPEGVAEHPARPLPPRGDPRESTPPGSADHGGENAARSQPSSAPAGYGSADPPTPDTGRELRRYIYVVKLGDTLSSIALELYGDETKSTELEEWNGLRDPNLIVPGQKLIYKK